MEEEEEFGKSSPGGAIIPGGKLFIWLLFFCAKCWYKVEWRREVMTR
jgi:hypothetical protein